jgi:non-specific protein-tyrosine kinase
MELRQYFSLVWKWTWLIVLAVLIAATSSFIASKAATPLYRTKTTMMIGRVTQNPDPNNVDLWTSQQLAYTYIQLARREPVLKGAIESLGLQMDWRALAGQISASGIPQTQLLEITVIDSDPYRAKVVADAIAQQLILLGPGTANKRNVEQDAFTIAQLEDLKLKIQDGQDEVIRLRQELDAANSARQIQDLQTRVSVLENKISGWQSTYSQLLISYQGGDVNALSVLEEADIPSTPFSPNVMNNVLVAAAIGLVLAAGGAFLIEYLDDTVKSPNDVTRATKLPNLVSIPFIEGTDYPDKLIAIRQPLSPVVESFRLLRTNLQFSMLDRPLTTLMMTSPSPSEGKSVALANLAVVLAQSGRKVIVVDTDLRRPTQHKIFGLPNRIGLTDALLEVISPNAEAIRQSREFKSALRSFPGKEMIPDENRNANTIAELFSDMRAARYKAEEPNPKPRTGSAVAASHQPAADCIEIMDLSKFLQETQVENLCILSTGTLPPNPAELLGSELMAMLIHTLKSQVDIVLFDSPPTLLFADAAVLSTRVDGVLLINDMGRTRTNESIRAADELRRVRANLIGVVLNRAGKREGNYNYYYYYYYQDGERKHRSSRARFKLPFEIPFLSRNDHKVHGKQKSTPTQANEE